MKIREIFFTIDGKDYELTISDGFNKSFLLTEVGKNANDQPLEQLYNIKVKTYSLKDRLKTLKFDFWLAKMRFLEWLKTRKKWGYSQKIGSFVYPDIEILVEQKNGELYHYPKRKIY